MFCPDVNWYESEGKSDSMDYKQKFQLKAILFDTCMWWILSVFYDFRLQVKEITLFLCLALYQYCSFLLGAQGFTQVSSASFFLQTTASWGNINGEFVIIPKFSMNWVDMNPWLSGPNPNLAYIAKIKYQSITKPVSLIN